MLAYRHVKPSRCAYAQNGQAAVAAVYSFIALYNDSPAPYVLAVHDWQVLRVASTFTEGFAVIHGQIGSGARQGQPVVSNRQRMPGIVTAGTLAALNTTSFYPSGITNNDGWHHEFPMVVLTPGWSLVMQLGTVNAALAGSFWWQVLTPEELDEMYGDEIDIRVS